MLKRRRGGRVVECTGFENRRGFIALPGFESLPLRHNTKKPVSESSRAFFLSTRFLMLGSLIFKIQSRLGGKLKLT